jgi:hypothetical protein
LLCIKLLLFRVGASIYTALTVCAVMAVQGYKTVTIPDETFDRLEALRAARGLRSLRETIDELIKEHEAGA